MRSALLYLASVSAVALACCERTAIQQVFVYPALGVAPGDMAGKMPQSDDMVVMAVGDLALVSSSDLSTTASPDLALACFSRSAANCSNTPGSQCCTGLSCEDQSDGRGPHCCSSKIGPSSAGCDY